MPVAVKLIDPAANEFLAGLEAKSKQPNPFYRAMANRPEALKAYVPFYASVVGPGAVDGRIKLLVFLTCSYANDCAFSIEDHIPTAKKAGVTEQEVGWLQTEQDQNFAENERAAIRYARELTQTAAADETRAALAEHFTGEQIVELTLLAGLANLNNLFNNALGIEREA
jgi:alkylhydroperoxidase family enzyme